MPVNKASVTIALSEISLEGSSREGHLHPRKTNSVAQRVTLLHATYELGNETEIGINPPSLPMFRNAVLFRDILLKHLIKWVNILCRFIKILCHQQSK